MDYSKAFSALQDDGDSPLDIVTALAQVRRDRDAHSGGREGRKGSRIVPRIVLSSRGAWLEKLLCARRTHKNCGVVSLALVFGTAARVGAVAFTAGAGAGAGAIFR